MDYASAAIKILKIESISELKTFVELAVDREGCESRKFATNEVLDKLVSRIRIAQGARDTEIANARKEKVMQEEAWKACGPKAFFAVMNETAPDQLIVWAKDIRTYKSWPKTQTLLGGAARREEKWKWRY